MWWSSIWSVSLTFLPFVVLGAVPAPLPYRPTALVTAAIYVLKQHVCPDHSTLAVIELFRKSNQHQQHDQNELLTHLLMDLGTEIGVQLLRDKPIERPKDHIVFLVDSAEAFRTLRFHFADSQFDNEFTFLILYMGKAMDDSMELEIEDMFETCFNFHVLNVILLVEKHSEIVSDEEEIDHDVGVLVYGYRLYGAHCNQSLTIQLLNEYKNGQLLREITHRNLFDRSMHSLYGCPLNISWFHLAPFVIFNGDSEDPVQLSESWRLSGIDGDLLKMLADIFDFRIQLRNPCDKCASPDTPVGTCGDCLNELATNNSSVAIGALSASHLYRNYFSTTSAYYQSSLIFVVHMDSKIGAVTQLALPFKRHVWLLLIIACILMVIVQAIWHRQNGSFDISLGGLCVLTILLGNPVVERRLPTMYVARLMLAVWLLMALVLRAAYQGKLYDVFRLPYSSSLPEQISDLLNNNYTLVAHEYYDFYPHERTRLTKMNYLRRFRLLEEECDSQTGERLTSTVLMANLAYYNQINWHTTRLTHVKEPIFLYQLVMYLRRHSVLKFPFDRKLKQLMSSGIVGHINRLYDQSKYRTPQNHHDVTTVPLITFCGLFTVSSILLTTAVVAIMLELLSLRFIWLRRYFE
ncbi:uncharacterized protein Dwil_GK27553 [Drosophila willistoni]|uniref:Putative ionotropic receptor ligand binding domain-containing protein n=1 Tax=Drosophila willistoni TaxID=7260 RepID=A0A0Q9X1A7_DROWI|nr:uncharacterized protein LOC26529555 [Drosophila willistoni]KRF99657.1 uncharacterized protein Dwil_GK27553 [Drosophila willistoni]